MFSPERYPFSRFPEVAQAGGRAHRDSEEPEESSHEKELPRTAEEVRVADSTREKEEDWKLLVIDYEDYDGHQVGVFRIPRSMDVKKEEDEWYEQRLRLEGIRHFEDWLLHKGAKETNEVARLTVYGN